MARRAQWLVGTSLEHGLLGLSGQATYGVPWQALYKEDSSLLACAGTVAR